MNFFKENLFRYFNISEFSYVENKRDIDWKFIKKIKKYSIKKHTKTNHKYDNKPYSYHLKMVYKYGLKYNYLLYDHELEIALGSCWGHDLIEDCRVTYNDLNKLFDCRVSEVIYALTNEKGRNRKERANKKYYDGINKNQISIFVKVCDRLANMEYSKKTGSSMYKKYKKENKYFIETLYHYRFKDMFYELENM